MLDLPEEMIRRYEYQDAAGGRGTRHFALPMKLVKSEPLHVQEFEALTGSPWNRWRVLLKPHVPDSKDSWAQVWISRFGVVLIHEYSDAHGRFAEIEMTDLFDPTRDYLIVEHSYYKDRKWELELLAGTNPPWAVYPQQWHDWVFNKEVQDSAFRYITGHVPSVTRYAIYASKRVNKLDMIAAWQKVSDEVQDELNIRLGRIASGSITSTMAMPIRIADKMSESLSPPWEPPIPRPVYQNPDESGRILIATPDPTRLRASNEARSASPRESDFARQR